MMLSTGSGRRAMCAPSVFDSCWPWRRRYRRRSVSGSDLIGAVDYQYIDRRLVGFDTQTELLS